MEACVFVALAGTGYVLNKLRKPSSSTASGEGDARNMAGDTPSSRNVYDSRFVQSVKAEEVLRATAAAHLALDSTRSGVVSRHARAVEGPTHPILRPSRAPPPPPQIHSTMSGVDIPVEHFTHNNMVPFYKGNATQNVEAAGYTSRLETFTGVDPLRPFGKKLERVPLFEPRRQDLYGVGADATRDAFMSSMQAPRNRAHENQQAFPVQRPGVSGGETGDVYYDLRKAALPPTVDELRAGANPKLTFGGRVIPGMGTTSARPAVSAFASQRPSLVREQGAKDFVGSRAATTRETQRPEVEARGTTRQETSRSHFGAAAAQDAYATTSRDATVRMPHRQGLAGPQQGPATAAGQKVDDYGLASIQVYGNERDVTTTRTYQGNLVTAVKAIVAPLADLVRGTRKEEFAEAPRAFGNIGPQGGVVQPKMTVYDSGDVARTTIKQTGIAEAPLGNLKGAVRITVYDPLDVARTTMRQTGIAEAPLGNLRGGAYRSTAYDPDDTARTTLKQTGLAEAPMANLRGAAYKGTAYDSEDVARTTQKQTQLYDAYGLAPITTGRVAGPAVDPDDAMRTTGRQTMREEDPVRNVGPTRSAGVAYDPEEWVPGVTHKQVLTDAGKGDYSDGNVGALQSRRGGAYATSDFVAQMTQKQLLVDSGTTYGGATGEQTGGYQVAPEDVRDTFRQTMADNDYYGNSSAPADKAAPMSYADAMAARTNGTREMLSEGRDPTSSSVKLAAGADQAGEVLIARAEVGYDAAEFQQPPGVPLFSGTDTMGQVGVRDNNGLHFPGEQLAGESRLDAEIAGARAQMNSNPFVIPGAGR